MYPYFTPNLVKLAAVVHTGPRPGLEVPFNMRRLLRYSRTSYGNLNENPQHRFAQRFALNIYPSGAIYSFIPKNACSTMRTSLAIANGCIKDPTDFNWIHQNNDTFSASLPELAKAKYTFTILRCPYARLLSVYLDKFVERNVEAWKYVNLHQRAIDIDDITFEFFVKSIAREAVRNSDIHWMPQTSFLVYEDYDDYFALEQYAGMAEVLQDKIGLELVDARPLTKHGTSGYRKLRKKEPYRLEPFELLQKKRQGFLPEPASMFSDEMARCVQRAYKQDIALYRKKFGKENLLFS